MSKIVKTPNYNLIKFDGIKYPLFLNDFSENMSIIDALINSINEDIEDINRIIDTVSTQNIDNLTARLDALEVKVDNNANIIASLADNLRSLSDEVVKNRNNITNIYSIINELQTDVADLKTCCQDVRNVLTTYGDRISNNENNITTINTELARVKNDVIGNARDIATLATQIQYVVDNKQDTLVPGTGITINGNVISASGGGTTVVGTYSGETLSI